MNETWSAVHSEGWQVFEGFTGTLAQAADAVARKPSGGVAWNEWIELRNSNGERWRVGPRGGVRKVKEVAS